LGESLLTAFEASPRGKSWDESRLKDPKVGRTWKTIAFAHRRSVAEKLALAIRQDRGFAGIVAK
jgi:hypothetical protein